MARSYKPTAARMTFWSTLTAAIGALAAGCGSGPGDSIRAWCKSVDAGTTAAAIATQSGAPADPGDPRGDGSQRPIFRSYTVDGRRLTDWQYADGVIISWSNGDIVAKQC